MKLSRINDPLDLEPVFPVEVPDHPGYYYFPDDNRVMVSKSGQVLNRDTKLPRKLKSGKRGYINVNVRNYGSDTFEYYYLHRILARTFIGRPSRHLDKPFHELQVNHINALRTDNSLDNLEWCTAAENINHALINDLMSYTIAIEAFNPMTNDRMLFRSIFDCIKHFNLPYKTLNSHLSKKHSGRIKKDGYIFRYKSNDVWNVNVDEYQKYREFINYRTKYQCVNLNNNFEVINLYSLKEVAKHISTYTPLVRKKLGRNNPCFINGFSITKSLRKEEDMKTSPVYERTVSAFPFSTGTSLSFESLFESTNASIDPNRQIPQHVNITDYNELWINVGTLFRNMFTAIPRDRVESTVSRDCVDVLIMEMIQILELVNEQSGNKTKVIYYICSYRGLEKEFKGITRRTPNTSKQKFYQNLLEETLDKILKRIKESNEIDIKYFDTFIRPIERCKALIITHYAVDLLSIKRFRVLDLLESHTGVLKKFNTWYTKYFSGKNLMMIPFNESLIKIFGDTELIVPYHFKVRRLIEEVANQNKWNYATSPAKVYGDLSKIKDHFARNEILKLL